MVAVKAEWGAIKKANSRDFINDLLLHFEREWLETQVKLLHTNLLYNSLLQPSILIGQELMSADIEHNSSGTF